MRESDPEVLAMRLAKLESELEIQKTLTDVALVRTYVLETALAHVANGLPIYADEVERIMIKELGGGKRDKRVKSAVAELRARLAAPKNPQLD